MRFPDLDAITVDGYGTLLELESPVPRLAAALAARSIDRSPARIAEAFEAEVRYYRPRSHLGRDARSLALLRRACVQVFLARLDAPLAPDDFVDDFVGALVFRRADGVVEALERLRTAGLAIAVVSNWDCSLSETLERIGILPYFDTVVTSAEAGAPKPHPEPYLLALERLGVEPGRALHIGDELDDQRGAQRIGMHFAPAPVSSAVAELR
jgi:FMN phosphatase YigB (HAD superfamily)